MAGLLSHSYTLVDDVNDPLSGLSAPPPPPLSSNLVGCFDLLIGMGNTRSQMHGKLKMSNEGKKSPGFTTGLDSERRSRCCK